MSESINQSVTLFTIMLQRTIHLLTPWERFTFHQYISAGTVIQKFNGLHPGLRRWHSSKKRKCHKLWRNKESFKLYIFYFAEPMKTDVARDNDFRGSTVWNVRVLCVTYHNRWTSTAQKPHTLTEVHSYFLRRNLSRKDLFPVLIQRHLQGKKLI